MSWRGFEEPWLFDSSSRYGYKLVYLLFDLNVYVSCLSEERRWPFQSPPAHSGTWCSPIKVGPSLSFHFKLLRRWGGFSSKDLSDIEGCSSRPCQMRSALAIMVRSSGGAASQLHNRLTTSVISWPVSIRCRKLWMHSKVCGVGERHQGNPANECQLNLIYLSNIRFYLLQYWTLMKRI